MSKYRLTYRILEFIAVVFSLAYTWMYLQGMLPLGYLPAALGAGLFSFICWKKQIYAESILQVFYVIMAGYGFLLSSNGVDVEAPNLMKHLTWFLIATVGTIGVGTFLKSFTDAKLPFLDAFTTVFSFIATWQMIHLVHENWIYWIVIDSVSIFLYARRGLKFGAILFCVYLLMAIDGYFEAINWF